MKTLKNNIVVEVDSPMEDTCAAMTLIKRIGKNNNLDIDLSIAYTFDSKVCGVYYPYVKGQEHRIFINPDCCKTQSDIQFQDGSEPPCCPGYTRDMTLFGITIHEFCHYLSYQLFPKIIKDFSENFPTQRLYLNDYSNNEIQDELAEILTLYICNPYLLRMISKEHWKFCKNYFKSPVACTIQRCRTIYNGFPICVKEEMKNKWNIIYNISTERFENGE